MQINMRDTEPLRTRSRSPENRYGKGMFMHLDEFSRPLVRRVVRGNSYNQHGYMKSYGDDIRGHASVIHSGSRMYSSWSKQPKVAESRGESGNIVAGRSIEYEEGFKPGYDWNEMLTFRTFVIMRAHEEATALETVSAYEEYKKSFHAERVPRFLWLIKELPVMTEKYSPELLRLEVEEITERCRVEASKFVKMLAEERFIGLCFVEQNQAVRSVSETSVSTSFTHDKLLPQQVLEPLTPPYWLPMDPDLNCICIRGLLPRISKWDLKEYVISHTGSDVLVDLSVTEPSNFELTLRGGNPRRIGWIRFVSDEACSAAELKLEKTTLKSTKLKPLRRIPNPQTYVWRVTPSEASHPARILRDLVLSARLILKLDDDFGVTELLGANTNLSTKEFEERCFEHPVLSELKHAFQGSGRSAEEQLDLQLLYLRLVHCVCYYSGRRYSSPRHLWELADALYVRPYVDVSEVIKQCPGFESSVEEGWDQEYTQAQDLREPEAIAAAAAATLFCDESYCFEPVAAGASGKSVPNHRQSSSKEKKLVKEEGLLEDDGEVDNKASTNNHRNNAGSKRNYSNIRSLNVEGDKWTLLRGRNSQWLQVLDNRIARLLNEDIHKPLALITEETPAVQERWNTACDKVIEEVAREKWRCGLCSKMFRGVEFVKKHLKNKHAELLDEIITDVRDQLIIQRYQSDPFRLPIAPPVITPYLYRRVIPSYPYENQNVEQNSYMGSAGAPSGEALTHSNFLANEKRQTPVYQYKDLDAPRPVETTKTKNMRETISYNDL